MITRIANHTAPADLKGRRVLVVGLGESGLAMARWMHRQQAAVCVVDTRAMPPGAAALEAAVPDAQWRHRGVPLVGDVIADCLSGIDLLLLSPGVAFDSPLVQAAQQQGVAVWSEIDCFLVAQAAACPASKILAITGANGKTTTTALTAHMLNAVGIDAVACGNISPSLLDAAMAREDAGRWPAVWVLELSSFQLEATQCMRSDAAIVLNLSEDHLDRHVTMAGYAAAKGRIYQQSAYPLWNRADRWADAYGLDLSVAASIGEDAPVRAEDFGLADGWITQGTDALLAETTLPLLGRHNALNVQAALALAQQVLPEACRIQDLLPGVRSFTGLPHRVSLVASIDGVRYVDDSKATNVGATLAALDGLYDPAMPARKIALLLGGEGKGQDFSPLTEAVQRAGRAVALIGADAAAIAAVLPASLPVAHFHDLPAATRWLADQAQPGDTVLLSPACASLDMFRNYAERARVFIDTVHALNGMTPLTDGEAA
jgi:UDP-N-acetylmuramoylalanine--D-glutamate ligase